MNSKQTVRTLKSEIQEIKKALLRIHDMRPGSLSRQYKDPKNRIGAYYQLSYTYRMKSKTEYVRVNDLPVVRQQITQYRQFRKLIQRWIDLALRLSRKKLLRML